VKLSLVGYGFEERIVLDLRSAAGWIGVVHALSLSSYIF
jgi:hypothetical protein